MRAIVACILLVLASAYASAGVLTHEDLVKRFPAPLSLGQKEDGLPVWPVYKQNATANELVGYLFESADLAPVPGFSGVPINLLIALAPNGSFIDVALLSHHEPVFLDGLGEGPLIQFVQQYKGISLKQNIRIENTKLSRQDDAAHAYLDGITKATASVRILNQSVLSAALLVARKKLGFGQASDPDQVARIRQDLTLRLGTSELLDQGLVQRVRLSNDEVEKLFAGSVGAGLDADALARPDASFIDLYLAWVSVPSVGRSLLTKAAWNKLVGRIEPGDHALLVMSSGRYSVLSEEFVRGSIPERIVLKQDKLPIDMRDLDLDLTLAQPGALPAEVVTVFRVIGQAGLDPAKPLDFALPIVRSKGIVYPERIVREVGFRYRLPERYVIAAESNAASWQGTWRARGVELGILVAGLAVLAVALAMQGRLIRDARRFARFRRAYLLFAIGFVGYYAQGQLSIVNITSVEQAVLAGRSLAFLLFDPMTVVLWVFALLSLVLWGRGTFCGWLCPFGAMQELVGKLAQALRLPQWKFGVRADARLKLIKYGMLAAVLASAALSNGVTDGLVEIEPFKTVITLNFVRSWPYVAYAVAMLAAGVFVYKFFCRYLCPFGAALALMGRFRQFDWIARRGECGTPCQTCRHRCDYQAIAPGGTVKYEECFQCMDCVVIHASDEKCAPLMLEVKRSRTIPVKLARPPREKRESAG